MLLALLTPFSRPSAHDWILCSWCDIMDGAEMEEAPVSHAALSLWAVVWGWPEVLLCVAGALCGGFLLCIAQVSMRNLPSLAVMPSAFLSLLSSCLVLPAVSLYNTVSYQKRDGAAQNLIPCWSGSTMLPTPFTCSALAVCALSLHHPWTPKEGCVHPHPQGLYKSRAALRTWDCSDDQLVVSISRAQA